jgi:2-amino-4-hydroxy-6-hydroxymethyldihydropteridine diphosphokinase
MRSSVPAFIGIGANLGDPVAQVFDALVRLGRDLPQTRLSGRSRLYRNPPMGPQDQPDYVNAVARLETRLQPRALLARLQAIEIACGRRRDGTRWGPRLLDLDLLLFGGDVIDEPGLRVPHPGIAERDFVLFPLLELAPGLMIPGLGPVAALCRAIPGTGLQAIAEEARA